MCAIDSLEDVLRNHAVDEIIFTISFDEIPNVEKYVSLAHEMGVCIRFLPGWHIRPFGFNPIAGSLHVEDFLGIPALSLITTPNRYGELFIKQGIDYLFSGIALILTMPLLPIFALAIVLCSKGPVFYKQKRIGLNGRRFIMYKFRTMHVDADQKLNILEKLNEADGPVFKIKNDPRIIPYMGRFLRSTNMDELPQLLNVIKGEMSLVGPRPPIPEEVEKYDVWQRRRLSMKPGITCLWQTTPNRNDLTFREWMDLDLHYIDNWSLFLDMKILLKTIYVVVLGTGR